MKPNCMTCSRLLTMDCPLYHPLTIFKSNLKIFWDSFSEIVKGSAVVCDLYERKGDEKGDDK